MQPITNRNFKIHTSYFWHLVLSVHRGTAAAFLFLSRSAHLLFHCHCETSQLFNYQYFASIVAFEMKLATLICGLYFCLKYTGVLIHCDDGFSFQIDCDVMNRNQGVGVLPRRNANLLSM